MAAVAGLYLLGGVLGCAARTGIVVDVSAGAGVADLFGLGATVTNCAQPPCAATDDFALTIVSDENTTPVALPARFILDLTNPAAGPVTVCVEGRNGGSVVAGGCASGLVVIGAVSTLSVTLDDQSCGNSVREGGEECDGSVDGASCTSLGYDGGVLACDASCAFDTSSCVLAGCGDGVIGPGEVCDGDDLDGYDCTMLGPWTGGTLACNSNCMSFNLNECTGSSCGDGVVDPGEDCDDLGESGTCNADCTTSTCGDGVLNMTSGESCDDAGESASCDADCTAATCGDGTVNATAGEQCDDGDANDANHCSNACTPSTPATLSGSHTFDTDTGMLDGVPEVHWDAATATWYVSGLDLQAGAVLTVVGSNPMIIDVASDATIAGTLDVAGQPGERPGDCGIAGAGGMPGPGGYAGGSGGGVGGSGTEDGSSGASPAGTTPATGGISSTATDLLWGGAGGGGGGHSVGGAPGMEGPGCSGGTGGSMYASLPPLVGGGGGGGGSVEKDGPLGGGLHVDDEAGSGGGGGGGAIALMATGTITVTGLIDAGGGDGGLEGLVCPKVGGFGGFGGGGAGGAIHLTAPAVTAPLATLNVAGGAGGVPPAANPAAVVMSGGDGADGVVLID